MSPRCTQRAKYEIPVRIDPAAGAPDRIDELLKLTVRGSDGVLVPLSELVQVVPSERDKPIYHKDLLPVVYVVGDMAASWIRPLYGMFGMRDKLNGKALEQGGTPVPNSSSASQAIPTPGSA